jgi:nucleoside-diphosphate-sugar epimerase
MMRVFLAGATGVLGRRALPLMLEAGHDVTAVARSPEKRKLLDRLGARALEVDLFETHYQPLPCPCSLGGIDLLCTIGVRVRPISDVIRKGLASPPAPFFMLNGCRSLAQCCAAATEPRVEAKST